MPRKATKKKKEKSAESSTSYKKPSLPQSKPTTEILGLAKDLADTLRESFPDHSVVYSDPLASLKYRLTNTFSTGLPNLDFILGVDSNGYSGMPYGRQIEISGPESSGKTNLVLQISKMIAAQGGLIHYYEMENVLDLNYAYRFVPEEQFIISQPDSVEEVFNSISETLDVYEKHRESGHSYPLGIIWDTVASSAAEQELDKDMDYTPHGLHSVKIGQGERRLVRRISGLPVLLVWTNQIRHNIPMGGMRMKLTRSAIGDVPLGHYAALRLRCASIADLVSGSDKVKFGRKINIKTIKNKIGGVVGEIAEEYLLNQGGFFQEFSMIEAMLDLGMVKLKGRTYTLQVPGVPRYEIVSGARLTEFRDLLYENPGLREQIISEIREKQRLKNLAPGFSILMECLFGFPREGGRE